MLCRSLSYCILVVRMYNDDYSCGGPEGKFVPDLLVNHSMVPVMLLVNMHATATKRLAGSVGVRVNKGSERQLAEFCSAASRMAQVRGLKGIPHVFGRWTRIQFREEWLRWTRSRRNSLTL